MGERRSSARVDVLGVGVDPVGKGDVGRWIEDALRGPGMLGCRQIVTLNPEQVMAARRDAEFAQAIAGAELVVADGVGVLVAGRCLASLQAKALARVTGVDLCEVLADACAVMGAPIFLLGGEGGVASGAAAKLVERHPRLRIGGVWEGGTPLPEDDAESLARIAAAAPHVILVAYGAPAQVLWIERNQAALGQAGVRIAIGVGGVFDYLSGRVPQAPRLVRRLGFEWLYRLGREPWRWRRQLELPRFAALVGLAVARRLRGR